MPAFVTSGATKAVLSENYERDSPEIPKPPNLVARGGVWFAVGRQQLHLGVEADFRPARKAHPAFRVADLPRLLERCLASGISAVEDEPLPGYIRAYVSDPFGNRIELLQPVDAHQESP